MNRYERIERLLYFREWAIHLATTTNEQVYVQMMFSTWRKLYDLGVILSDVGKDNPGHLLFQIERVIGLGEKLQEQDRKKSREAMFEIFPQMSNRFQSGNGTMHKDGSCTVTWKTGYHQKDENPEVQYNSIQDVLDTKHVHWIRFR